MSRSSSARLWSAAILRSSCRVKLLLCSQRITTSFHPSAIIMLWLPPSRLSCVGCHAGGGLPGGLALSLLHLRVRHDIAHLSCCPLDVAKVTDAVCTRAIAAVDLLHLVDLLLPDLAAKEIVVKQQVGDLLRALAPPGGEWCVGLVVGTGQGASASVEGQHARARGKADARRRKLTSLPPSCMCPFDALTAPRCSFSRSPW